MDLLPHLDTVVFLSLILVVIIIINDYRHLGTFEWRNVFHATLFSSLIALALDDELLSLWQMTDITLGLPIESLHQVV